MDHKRKPSIETDNHQVTTIISEKKMEASIQSIDVDTMLYYAGDFGKYQHILMLLFSTINVLSALHYFGQTFTSIVPNHEIINHRFPNVTGNSCIYEHDNATDSLYGYVSIVEELNWCGDDDWKPALGQSVFFIGSVIGSLSLGMLADRIGRLHVLVIANFFAFLGNGITIFSTEIYTFSISRFIAGLATDSNFVMMYIIVMEYIRPSMRTLGLNLCIGVFYCVACVAVPWLAILMGTWKKFLLIVSIPHLLVLGFYFLIPESAQWLISNGKTEDAIKCFERIAVINKKEIKPHYIEGLRVYSSQHINHGKTANILGLFKTPKLRKKTLILIFKSMVMTLCYDAISKNVNDLGFSPFVLFSVTSITILPACLIITYYQDKIGRKAMASSSLLVSGIFTSGAGYILAAVETPNNILTTSLMFIARLSINVAYNSGAQYAVELIPTEVRGQGVSAIHVAGYAASFFSMQILYLRKYWMAFPEFILGALLILGAIACLMLPETLNKTLPVSLKDGEEFGEDEGIWEFACCSRRSESQTILTQTKI